MKNNLFKYIFLVVIVILVIFAIYKINNTNSEKKIVNQEQTTIKQGDSEVNLAIAEFDNMNPIISKNKNVQEISKLIFDPLINITENFKLEGGLAIEWAKTADNSYIIKLRENVLWSNGEKFTGEDVRFTIDRLKDTDSIYSYNVQYVIGVDVIDDYTVRIALDRNVPFFEYNLTFPILNKKYFEGQDFKNTEKNKKIIGTGMYKITNIEDTKITLEENDTWWKKENLFLKKVSINLYSSMGEVYNAFKLGSVDFISTSNKDFQNYVGTIGYNYKEIKNREHVYLAFNTQSNILSNLEVRQAIAGSIDKENIVAQVFANKAYISSYPLDYGSFLYKGSENGYQFNTENAKQILVNNGWNYKNKYWQKSINGRYQRLSLNLVVKSTNANCVATANIIKQQLENQGIRINIINASNDQYNRYIQNKNYDMILCDRYLSTSPDMTNFFGENNTANYNNEEAKKILVELNSITDENLLKEKNERLEQLYKLEIPYLSIYTGKTIVLYNNELTGDISSNWYNLYYNIKNWCKN